MLRLWLLMLRLGSLLLVSLLRQVRLRRGPSIHRRLSGAPAAESHGQPTLLHPATQLRGAHVHAAHAIGQLLRSCERLSRCHVVAARKPQIAHCLRLLRVQVAATAIVLAQLVQPIGLVDVLASLRGQLGKLTAHARGRLLQLGLTPLLLCCLELALALQRRLLPLLLLEAPVRVARVNRGGGPLPVKEATVEARLGKRAIAAEARGEEKGARRGRRGHKAE
jgi:hypothetical protein